MKTVSKPAGPVKKNPVQQPAQQPAATTQSTDDFLDELNAGNAVALPEDMTGIDDDAAFDLIEKADASQLKEMTSAYWKPSGAGTWVFKFTGMTTVSFDGDVQEAVELEDRNGIKYTAAQAVLVNSLKKVTELPTFCKVICDGRKLKSKQGEYFNMQVLVFPSAAKQ